MHSYDSKGQVREVHESESRGGQHRRQVFLLETKRKLSEQVTCVCV